MREGHAKTWAWESSYYLDGSRCQPRFPPHVECGGLAAALRVEPSHQINEIAASRPVRAAFDFNFFTLKPLNPCTLKSQLLHRKVTTPSNGCTISTPLRRDSIKLAFNPKYHLAGRSASSININLGSCFNPSACRIIVSWSCRKKVFPNIRNKPTGKKGKFQAATKSIRHKSRRTGVTVARLENHIFPL